MIRTLAFLLVTGLAVIAEADSGTNETLPNIHNELITVRIRDGRSGQPLPHLHLLLAAGYDQGEVRGQLWREEIITDEQGQVRLSKQLANLPFLQVWVTRGTLCQANPRAASFSVERIHRDGLSTPNLCGIATVEDIPGVLTVFVKSKAKNAPLKSFAAVLTAQTAATAATAKGAASVQEPSEMAAHTASAAPQPIDTDAASQFPLAIPVHAAPSTVHSASTVPRHTRRRVAAHPRRKKALAPRAVHIMTPAPATSKVPPSTAKPSPAAASAKPSLAATGGKPGAAPAKTLDSASQSKPETGKTNLPAKTASAIPAKTDKTNQTAAKP